MKQGAHVSEWIQDLQIQGKVNFNLCAFIYHSYTIITLDYCQLANKYIVVVYHLWPQTSQFQTLFLFGL